MTARRHGFTLIEVAVALSVAAIVLLTAREIVGAVSDGSAAVARRAWHQDAHANANRLARSLLRSIVSDSSTTGLAGRERAVVFRGWCPVAGGWLEQCEVTLAIEQDGHSSALALYPGPPDRRLVLSASPGGAAFRFVKDGNPPIWLASWMATRELPAALAVVRASDTLLLKVGSHR